MMGTGSWGVVGLLLVSLCGERIGTPVKREDVASHCMTL